MTPDSLPEKGKERKPIFMPPASQQRHSGRIHNIVQGVEWWELPLNFALAVFFLAMFLRSLR